MIFPIFLIKDIGEKMLKSIVSGNKGNGIGLYFVKLLCDLHNITVKAESDGNIKNVGGIPYSIFSIILTFNDVYDEEEIKNISLYH